MFDVVAGQLMLVLLISVRLIPIAIAVWVVFALRSIRREQRTAQLKLESIERLLQRS